MQSKLAEFKRALTPFVITSWWSSLDAENMRHGRDHGGFEVATWADSLDAQRRARVVVGKSGLLKNAYGPAGGFSLLVGRSFVYTS